MVRVGGAAFLLSVMVVAPVVPCAHAQSAPTSVPAATAPIDLKFQPPLGRTLRYRLNIVRYRDGKPTLPQPMIWVEELRYEKAEQGYVLYWRMDPASLPLAMRAPLLVAALKPYMGEPIAFDVDEAGTVKRVRDWARAAATLRGSAATARPLLITQPGATPAIVDKVIADVGRQFDGLTAETAPAVILMNIIPMLGWNGGAPMAVGDTIEGDAAMPVPLYGTTVKSHAKLTMVAADAQTATIVDREWIDQDEFRRLVATMAKTYNMKPPATDGSANLDSTIRLTFDRPSGLITVFDSERREGADGPLVEKRVITWLR